MERKQPRVSEQKNKQALPMLLQVAEWTDEKGFTPVAAKYVRLRPFSEIERNRTYIVTTIVVGRFYGGV